MRLLGLPLRTIVAVELVGAAVLLATDVSVVGGVVVVAVAAAIALALVLPVGGLRLGSWLATLIGYAARRRVFAAPPPAPAGTSAPAEVTLPDEVRALFPGIAATEQATRGAGRIGLLQWNGTWSCIVAVHPADPDVLQLDAAAQLPVERVLAALAGAGLDLDAVTVIAQSLVGDPERSGGGSLAAIAGELGGSGPLVRGRSTWVSIRIDPVAAGPAITARGGGATGLGRLAAAAVGRVVSEAAAAGLAAEPLGAEAAGRAMAAAVLQPPTDGAAARWIESTTGLASAEVHHRCFAVTSWGNRSLSDVAVAGGFGLTVAHEVRGLGTGAAAEVRTVVRLSALSASQLDRSATRLRRAARSAGVGVRTLRAQQAAAFRATVPGGQR